MVFIGVVRARSTIFGKTLLAYEFMHAGPKVPVYCEVFNPFLDYFGQFVRKLSDLGVLAGLIVCMDDFSRSCDSRISVGQPPAAILGQ